MSQSSAPAAPTIQHSPGHVATSSANAQAPRDRQINPALPGNRTPRSVTESTSLPPLASLTGPTEGSAVSPTTWRSGGLHNILNPSEPSSSAQQYRPVQVQDARPSQPPSTFASPRGRKRGESHSPSLESDAPSSVRFGRRILTPRSPGVRAASLGAHRSPSIGSSLGSRRTPYGSEGRQYVAEPGTHNDAAIPPMPPLPVTRGFLPTIQTATHDLRHPRRASASTATPLTASSAHPLLVGGGAGPSSTFTQQRTFSPTYQPPPPSQHRVGRTHGMHADGGAGYQGLHGPAIGQGLPRVQSGWKMALETGQGREVVEVDIDYRQASKMADEKRKRNAGASARFRARRKEKEKESSQMISGLQQELHEMTEERDFYLHERNFFRDLLARSSAAPLPQRPQSPRIRHSLNMSVTSNESSTNHPYDPREASEMGIQRRRTGDYQPSFEASPNTTSYTPPYPSSGQAYGPPRAIQTTNFHAEHRTQQNPPSGHHHAPPPPLAPARSQEMDPYRHDLIDRWHPPQP